MVIQVAADTEAETVDLRQAFVDLLLEDMDLVRSEFEAIVAEEQWWEPTPPEVPSTDPGQPPPRRIPRSDRNRGSMVAGEVPGRRWVRERSPPRRMSS